MCTTVRCRFFTAGGKNAGSNQSTRICSESLRFFVLQLSLR
ncbi:hypothetical protein CLOSTMETH_03836 [[Clostridium] methylpentosum DSM 5476]|uniref:Uncharacterized protein n=1 Tax=[Clostridium] methylpentosum DSM 5476 TaxID=537013 RepID=C0EIZ0_9FIRM|nr:hypothetical protein CLOSTMETH_03836 [[Clostridium] methylpentosum DSM 5476]